MLVGVTGATGFVGVHSVAAIVQAGHRVRALVRDPDRAARVMRTAGVDQDAVEPVQGDVTDAASVARALRGVDGVLHCASVFSFDSRQHRAIRQTAAAGTETVLSAAVEAGANPIVHVSSFGALLPAAGPVTAGTPVGRSRETYLASKAAAEIIARGHQETGAPVVITYPPALLGPGDPKLGDQNARLRDMIRGLMPIWPLGGLPLGDVRDTAALHASLFSTRVTSPGAHHRHFSPSTYLTTRQYVRAVRDATGLALPTLFVPARALLPVGAVVAALQRIWPWHIPAEYGAIYTCAVATPIGHQAGPGRPIERTITDTVRWLAESGHLSRRKAARVSTVDTTAIPRPPA